jgi:hypothetical protein
MRSSIHQLPSAILCYIDFKKYEASWTKLYGVFEEVFLVPTSYSLSMKYKKGPVTFFHLFVDSKSKFTTDNFGHVEFIPLF